MRTVEHTQNAEDDNTPSPPYNSAESHKDASDDLEEIDTEICAMQDEEIRMLTGVTWHLLPSMFDNCAHSTLIIF